MKRLTDQSVYCFFLLPATLNFSYFKNSLCENLIRHTNDGIILSRAKALKTI